MPFRNAPHQLPQRKKKKSPPEGRLFNIKTHGVLFPFSRIANADTRDSRIANSGKRGLSIISLSDKPFVILVRNVARRPNRSLVTLYIRQIFNIRIGSAYRPNSPIYIGIIVNHFPHNFTYFSEKHDFRYVRTGLFANFFPAEKLHSGSNCGMNVNIHFF